MTLPLMTSQVAEQARPQHLPDLWPNLWPDPPARPRLFVDVQHGLCNRLRAMASGAALAQASGRELVVIWRPDHHCAGRISDILNYTGTVIEDDTADLCRRFARRVYNYMEIEPGAQFEEPLMVLEDQGDIYVRSAYTLTSPQQDFAAEQRFLRALMPSQAVQDLVAQVPHPSDLALHIRTGTGPGFDHLSYESPDNWPAHRHDELIYWRGQSQPEAFVRQLDHLLGQGAETFFLAADQPQSYQIFARRYGARMRYLPRDLYDRSARQLQYALADLILLTQADHMLASTWSSFSDLAQRLARPGRSLSCSGKDF